MPGRGYSENTRRMARITGPRGLSTVLAPPSGGSAPGPITSYHVDWEDETIGTTPDNWTTYGADLAATVNALGDSGHTAPVSGYSKMLRLPATGAARARGYIDMGGLLNDYSDGIKLQMLVHSTPYATNYDPSIDPSFIDNNTEDFTTCHRYYFAYKEDADPDTWQIYQQRAAENENSSATSWVGNEDLISSGGHPWFHLRFYADPNGNCEIAILNAAGTVIRGPASDAHGSFAGTIENLRYLHVTSVANFFKLDIAYIWVAERSVDWPSI